MIEILALRGRFSLKKRSFEMYSRALINPPEMRDSAVRS